MTQSEKEAVAKVVNYFWGVGTVSTQRVTPHLSELVYDVLLEADRCSSAMNLVPRPVGGKPSLTHIVKQFGDIAKRLQQEGGHAPYLICKTRISLLYKSVIIEALIE